MQFFTDKLDLIELGKRLKTIRL